MPRQLPNDETVIGRACFFCRPYYGQVRVTTNALVQASVNFGHCKFLHTTGGSNLFRSTASALPDSRAISILNLLFFFKQQPGPRSASEQGRRVTSKRCASDLLPSSSLPAGHATKNTDFAMQVPLAVVPRRTPTCCLRWIACGEPTHVSRRNFAMGR